MQMIGARHRAFGNFSLPTLLPSCHQLFSELGRQKGGEWRHREGERRIAGGRGMLAGQRNGSRKRGRARQSILPERYLSKLEIDL